MNPSEWFTEEHVGAGSAFSLKIKRKLDEAQSPFQHHEIYETETFGNLMVLDGCTMVSTRDNFLYHEMMSHPGLIHPSKPQKSLDYWRRRLRYIAGSLESIKLSKKPSKSTSTRL